MTTGALRSSGRPQRPRPPLAKSKPSSPHPKLTLIKAVVDGKLPAKAPVVTSAANPHYQKHFDKLFAHAQAGEWDAVCDDKITGSNSYSKMVARYRQDLLAVHAAQEASQGTEPS